MGEPTLLLTAANAPPGRRAELAQRAEIIVAGADRVDLRRAPDALAERGHNRVLCEGRPRLLGQLVADGLLDDLCVTFAPLLRGGNADRALNGPAVPDVPVQLIHILEEDGNLITRWLRAAHGGRGVGGSP